MPELSLLSGQAGATGAPARPRPPVGTDEPLLEITGLSIRFTSPSSNNRVVEDVSFAIQPGQVLAVVGESGCGKSVTSLSIMRLLDPAVARVEGAIRFAGRDLLALSERQMRGVRGNDIAMIFQEPMTSLNPAYTIGEQIVEAIRQHSDIPAAEAWRRAVALLDSVAMPDPERRVREYPHRLSGGMRQRAMVAMALACDPRLLIADEPTTALDVTIQAEILDLLSAIRDKTGTAILLITHDLGVVAELADAVLVMYAGQVMERGRAADLFSDPQHPYTIGLMSSAPDVGTSARRLPAIPGWVPPAGDRPDGCVFHPRCPFARDICRESRPALREVKRGQWAACWFAPLGIEPA